MSNDWFFSFTTGIFVLPVKSLNEIRDTATQKSDTMSKITQLFPFNFPLMAESVSHLRQQRRRTRLQWVSSIWPQALSLPKIIIVCWVFKRFIGTLLWCSDESERRGLLTWILSTFTLWWRDERIYFTKFRTDAGSCDVCDRSIHLFLTHPWQSFKQLGSRTFEKSTVVFSPRYLST